MYAVHQWCGSDMSRDRNERAVTDMHSLSGCISCVTFGHAHLSDHGNSVQVCRMMLVGVRPISSRFHRGLYHRILMTSFISHSGVRALC